MHQTALLIEDEPDFANLLSSFLTAHGWNTVRASVVQEAMDWLAAHPPPDLLLLDIGLPDAALLPDLLLMLRIQRAAGAPVLPMIVLSDSREPLLESSAKTFGAIGFLCKEVFLHDPDTLDALLVAQVGGVPRSDQESLTPLP